jgi:hypothetical protein
MTKSFPGGCSRTSAIKGGDREGEKGREAMGGEGKEEEEKGTTGHGQPATI